MAKNDPRLYVKDYEVDRLLELLAAARPDSINKALIKKLSKKSIDLASPAAGGFDSIFAGLEAMQGSKAELAQPAPAQMDAESILRAAMAGEATEEQKEYYFKTTGFKL